MCRLSLTLALLFLVFWPEHVESFGSLTIKIKSPKKFTGSIRVKRYGKSDILEPIAHRGTENDFEDTHHLTTLQSGLLVEKNPFETPIHMNFLLFHLDSNGSMPRFSYNLSAQPFAGRKILCFVKPALLIEIDFRCDKDWAGSKCDKFCDFGEPTCNWFGCVPNYDKTPTCEKPLCSGIKSGTHCQDRIDLSDDKPMAPVRSVDNMSQFLGTADKFYSGKMFVNDSSDNYQLEYAYN